MSEIKELKSQEIGAKRAQPNFAQMRTHSLKMMNNGGKRIDMDHE